MRTGSPVSLALFGLVSNRPVPSEVFVELLVGGEALGSGSI